MRYLVLLIDGAADEPCEKLCGKTPLTVAVKPTMDMLAGKGVMGMVRVTPEGCKGGSDVGNLTVMGSADHLIAAIGVEDLVIVNTGDVTLVCRASEAQRIKELLKLADTRPELRKFL